MVRIRIRSYAKHYYETLKHKWFVLFYLSVFSGELLVRGFKHDLSKFKADESKGFSRVIHGMKYLEYGSDEYREILKELSPTIQRHYDRNPHHPEHSQARGYGGAYGMSLLDVVEMYFDWKAACRRHRGGDIEESVLVNRDRFEFSDELASILTNEATR